MSVTKTAPLNTPEDFAAAYLAACIELESAVGLRARGEDARIGERIAARADRKGIALDVYGIGDRAQRMVHFPAHMECRLTYTRNTMRCTDCQCDATESPKALDA